METKFEPVMSGRRAPVAPLPTMSSGAGDATLPISQNAVLRNTYWLLALSMVPTVLGAWVGVQTGIASAMSPGIGLVVFLAGAFGFMFAIEKNKNNAAGVPILLAFTFFMGLMLARLLGVVLGMNNGSGLIMTVIERPISFGAKSARPHGVRSLRNFSITAMPIWVRDISRARKRSETFTLWSSQRKPTA